MRELASGTMKIETLDSELYQDATTGRWLQRGGSRIGKPDEIDTSVHGESPREKALRRQAVTETLVPLDLLIQMPPPELRGLELLLDVLSSCESFRVTSRGGGLIICRLDEDVDIEIRVEYMVRARLEIPWEGNTSLSGLRPPHDLHLACSMQLVDSESRWLAVNNHGKERVEVCLSSYFRLSPAEGRRWDWEEYDLQIELGQGPLMEDPRTGLSVPDLTALLPVTDSIVTWALWAQSGFPNPPESFILAYEQLTFPYAFEGCLPEYMTDQNGWEPWDDEFEPAIFWERLLESGTRARRHPQRTCNVSVSG